MPDYNTKSANQPLSEGHGVHVEVGHQPQVLVHVLHEGHHLVWFPVPDVKCRFLQVFLRLRREDVLGVGGDATLPWRLLLLVM